jgi:hypothetical protein
MPEFLGIDNRVSLCKANVANSSSISMEMVIKAQYIGGTPYITTFFLFSILVLHCHTNWSSDEPVSVQKKSIIFILSTTLLHQQTTLITAHLTVYSFLGHFQVMYQLLRRCDAK